MTSNIETTPKVIFLKGEHSKSLENLLKDFMISAVKQRSSFGESILEESRNRRKYHDFLGIKTFDDILGKPCFGLVTESISGNVENPIKCSHWGMEDYYGDNLLSDIEDVLGENYAPHTYICELSKEEFCHWIDTKLKMVIEVSKDLDDI